MCAASFSLKKNHRLLIEMYARYSSLSDSPRKLVLVGEGKEFESIKADVELRGFSDMVLFVGKTMEIEKFYAECAIVLLPSQFEGFPNVLVEGIASGRPFISFDIPTGPAFIARACAPGVGLLVRPFDSSMFVEAMLQFDNPERVRFSQKKAAESRKVFCEDTIVPLWFELTDE